MSYNLPAGTNRYFNKVVKKFGVEIDMVDPTNLKAVQAGIKPNTKVRTDPFYSVWACPLFSNPRVILMKGH